MAAQIKNNFEFLTFGYCTTEFRLYYLNKPPQYKFEDYYTMSESSKILNNIRLALRAQAENVRETLEEMLEKLEVVVNERRELAAAGS